jgi:hypothetical protein
MSALDPEGEGDLPAYVNIVDQEWVNACCEKKRVVPSSEYKI